MKRDPLFILEKLFSVLDENRVEMLARQHGIQQKRDDGGVSKTLAAFFRRADEGTLSRLMVEASILLATSRGNPATVLKSAYKVDTEAIAAKVKQEFTAKEKAKKTPPPTTKTARKAASLTSHRGAAMRRPSSFRAKIAPGDTPSVSPEPSSRFTLPDLDQLDIPTLKIKHDLEV